MDAVVVRRGEVSWHKLPVWAKTAITQGAERIRRVRESIQVAAGSVVMPVIDVRPVLVTSATGFPAATAVPVKRGNELVLGVEASASLCGADDAEIRSVLIHEFSHCFKFAEEVCLSIERGERELTLLHDPAVDEFTHDDRMHVSRPERWFGRGVAVELTKTSHMSASVKAYVERWQAARLPIDGRRVVANADALLLGSAQREPGTTPLRLPMDVLSLVCEIHGLNDRCDEHRDEPLAPVVAENARKRDV